MSDSKNYWWLVANPKIWSFSELEIGQEWNYKLLNENGNKRRVHQHFLDAKVDDVLVVYETSPSQFISGLARVSQANDGEKLCFTKTEHLENPVTLKDLSTNEALAEMEYFSIQQASLLKLSKNEYEVIVEMIMTKNPISQFQDDPEATTTIDDASNFDQALLSYKANFNGSWWEKEKYKWEAVKHFQEHWNIDAEDFVEMFKQATEKAGNLLTSARRYPRGMIVDFAKRHPDIVKNMFTILYDETKSLADRLVYFTGQVDRITELEVNLGWKNHYQDANAISTYLWLRYPDRYYIFKYIVYKNVSEYFGFR